MTASSKHVKLLEPHVDHAGTDSRKRDKQKRESSNSGFKRAGRLPKICGNCSLRSNSAFPVHFDAFCIVGSRKIKLFVAVVVVRLKSVPLL
jgi:hypothetical protein